MPARILIADDYEDNRELLRLLLLSAEYEVLEARDGQECVDVACEDLPDLILVDLSMPKLDGWEVLRAIRTNPKTSSIPVIAATASADLDRVRAIQAGFDAYINKPFHTAQLLDIVGGIINAGLIMSSKATKA
ncbi:MAG TPA: response regulator [Pyrinomonadaceae bacterium]|jgi:CheY-like chemotaxis protein|nr:response regulator [Pyrinomonadaceae bacterium]